MSTNPSRNLSEAQVHVLRHFLNQPQSELPYYASPAAAEHLIERGLLERVPILSLPGQPLRYHYRLTPQGQALFKKD